MTVLDDVFEDPSAKAVVFSQWLGAHEVFMQGTRLSQFIKSVEQVAGAMGEAESETETNDGMAEPAVAQVAATGPATSDSEIPPACACPSPMRPSCSNWPRRSSPG